MGAGSPADSNGMSAGGSTPGGAMSNGAMSQWLDVQRHDAAPLHRFAQWFHAQRLDDPATTPGHARRK